MFTRVKLAGLRAASPLLLLIVAWTVGRDIYIEWVVDDSAIWVELAEPDAEPAAVEAGQTRMLTYWSGYRRRDCDTVQWWRILERATEDGSWSVVAKIPAPASRRTRTEPADEPSEYELTLPAGLVPGEYRWRFEEWATCYPGRTWVNPVGVIGFYVVP